MKVFERYAGNSWEDQIRDNLGRWAKESIPEVKIHRVSIEHLWRHISGQTKQMRGKSIKNEETGWHIKIDRDGLKKMAGRGDPSAYALSVLPELLAASVLLESKKPNDPSDTETIAFHQLGHPAIIHGNLHAVKITVRELKVHGHRAYSLHAIEIEKGSPQKPVVGLNHTDPAVGEPSAINIDDAWSKIKEGNDYYSTLFADDQSKHRYALITFGDLDKWPKRAPLPTEAQREAGNYEKGHIRFHGLDIAIETPKGRRRRPEWPPMAAHYGYFKRTLARDGDSIDVFVGPNESSELVYVIDQSGPSGKRFDEHKIMLGFDTQSDAVDTYRKCYTPGWTVGPVTAMTMKQFRAWLEEGDHKKPLHCQVSKYEISTDLYLAPDEVAKALGVIERYEWRAEEHPRWEQGSAGSVGGRFRGQGSSRLREVAALPDTVREGHSLHLSALGNRDRVALKDWSTRLHEAMAHVKGDDEEGQWQSTNKGYIRALLQEMNERDRDARARGVRLSDYVNANGLIPEALAARLHGGRRFFDPETIRDKLKSSAKPDPKASKEAERQNAIAAFKDGSREQRKQMLSPESNFREAIMRAMGLNPDLKGPEDPGGHWQTLGNKNRTEAGDSVGTLPSTKPKPINPSAPEAAPASFSEPQQPEQGSGAVASTKTEFDALPKRSQKKIDEAIRLNDPDMPSDLVADIRNEVMDTWKQLSEQANEHNHAVRQIMSGFSKHWGLVSARLKQGADPDKIHGFDEMVDFARSHYPGVLSKNRGESDTGSDEESLAKVLVEGLKPLPKPGDDDVIRTTSERIWSAMASASRFQPDPELDSVPFSVARWAEIIRYAMNEKLPIPFFGTIAL